MNRNFYIMISWKSAIKNFNGTYKNILIHTVHLNNCEVHLISIQQCYSSLPEDYKIIFTVSHRAAAETKTICTKDWTH